MNVHVTIQVIETVSDSDSKGYSSHDMEGWLYNDIRGQDASRLEVTVT